LGSGLLVLTFLLLKGGAQYKSKSFRKKALRVILRMDATFSISFSPLVLILLSIFSYCSVSATPVPQQYGGNYRRDPSSSFNSGYNGGKISTISNRPFQFFVPAFT
jgi:hypothetical protein